MFHLLLAVIYLAFISLGLPDALLGCAWPTIYPAWSVPVSWAGIISLIISAGTVASSLMSDRITRVLGPGKVTALSVTATALALWGYSVSGSFWSLCLWAIPYGLGAGSVDAALNNYVALHYSSRHMSWLHCMWGIGASAGPYIMSWVLSGGRSWPVGFRTVAIIQIGLSAVLFLTLPMWKSPALRCEETVASQPLTLPQILSLPGAREVMAAFFCYCGMETTAGLWSASYLVLHAGFEETAAARYAALFYLGMTAGRAASGFVAVKLDDRRMIRLGQLVAGGGIAAVLLPLGGGVTLAGLLLIGLGCAPIYPCFIHATPDYFGADKSQAVIGVQMASAYVGTSLMPPLFGLIADHVSPGLFPVFLLVLLVGMITLHEKLLRGTRG